MISPITSLTNQKVKDWTRLHQKKYRDQTKQFIVEEEHLIQEAIASNVLKTLIVTDLNHPFDFDNIELVDQKVMDKLSTNVSQVKYIGICEMKETKPQNLTRVILLDNVQDPGNVGTIIRTAVSFGFDQVILSKDSCDVYNDKCIRASQGAIFKMNIIREDLISKIEELKNNEFYVVATSLRNSIEIEKLEEHKKMAFILGNEGQGVSDTILNHSDCNVIIPIQNFESLNVAIAGSIVMYLFRN